jgi:ABC-type transporter Mla subunit MlaD
MTLEVHTVELRAVDHASQTFRQFGNEGQKAAKDVEQSFDKASESQKRFSVSSAAVGAALGTGIGLMGDWARAAAEDQAGQERLQQSIENTGKSYSDYSQQIEKAIAVGQKRAFSDDQIRDSLVQMTNATHDAGKSLADLSLAEDLARARKIDLAAATQIVVNAEEHRYGALARMGIVLDKNATSEEALAAIQQTVAGQADVYAKSNLGWMEQQKIKVDELTESWGYALGPLQQITTLLPGLSAGFTGISGALAGMGGISGLAGLAPLLAQGAGIGALGTIAYGYSQNDVGTTFANELANKIFLVMASLINAAFPGANPLDTQKYTDQMAKNSTWDQILAVFGSPEAAGKALGVQGSPIYSDTTYGTGASGETSGNIGYDVPNGPGMTQGTTITGYEKPSDDQVYAAIVAAAAAGNMTVAQYLATPAARKAGMIATATPGTGYGGAYTTGYGSLAGAGKLPTPIYNPYQIDITRPNPQSGHFITNPNHPEYGTGGSGAVANDINAQIAGGQQRNVAIAGPYNNVAQQNRLTTDLGKLNQGYLGLTDGVMSANDALATFKSIQDGILQSEQVYTGQLGEYNTQLNNLDNAYAIINKKKQDGIELTKQETDFLNGYADAHDRLAGGVNDATEQLGFEAEKYAENMKAGDQLNDTVGDLTASIYDLILMMNDVPSEVRTQVLLDKYNATQSISDYISYLNSIPYSKTTTIYTDYVVNGAPPGVHKGSQLGGVIPAAAHGRYIGGPYTLVGEDGPEIMVGGQGGMVIPASATRAKRQAMGGGGTVIHNMTVIANDTAQFARQMRSQAVTGSRR